MSIQYTIKIEGRDRLYYDQFKYSFSFKQSEVFALRGLPPPQEIMRFINRRRDWMQTLNRYGHRQDEHFTSQSIENILATRELLMNHPTPFKMTVSGDWASIYTDDLNLADRISRLPYVSVGRYVRQALVNKPRDVVAVRNPQYQYRTYFKERKMKPEIRKQLLTWVESQNYQNQVYARPSKVFLTWLKNQSTNWRSDWCMRHFYIEHDDLRYETMISMVAPGYVRKTMTVTSTADK